MHHTHLGPTGLTVSRIVLGCMSFGDGNEQQTWTLDAEAAEPVFREAVELGITFWDTANVYGRGSSERVTGEAIRKYTRREDVVLATKLFGEMGPGPGESGLSRRAGPGAGRRVLAAPGAPTGSTSTRSTASTRAQPVEETMEALHDVVKAGKVRYLGASSMWAWQFAKLQSAADLGGWTRFVSMQNQYSLGQREEEREMFPAAGRPGRRLDPLGTVAGGEDGPPLERAEHGPRGGRPQDRPQGQPRPARQRQGHRRRCRADRGRAGRPDGRRSPWRGCCATPSSTPPSSGRRRCTTCATPSRPWTSN